MKTEGQVSVKYHVGYILSVSWGNVLNLEAGDDDLWWGIMSILKIVYKIPLAKYKKGTAKD